MLAAIPVFCLKSKRLDTGNHSFICYFYWRVAWSYDLREEIKDGVFVNMMLKRIF
jgi:hypothetical protein